jgi:ATP-dependent DNA helicase RecG
MVLQYVHQHGQVTRKEGAELCRIGPDQATRLLDRLVTHGKMQRVGAGRGVYYSRRRQNK